MRLLSQRRSPKWCFAVENRAFRDGKLPLVTWGLPARCLGYAPLFPASCRIEHSSSMMKLHQEVLLGPLSVANVFPRISSEEGGRVS